MMTLQEKELIFSLAERITGSCQHGKYRKNVLIKNVERRMAQSQFKKLSQYLHFTESNEQEFQQLIGALTIHTTNWFRELPHYHEIESYLTENFSRYQQSHFKVLCCACSTGENVYSLGLLLETFRQKYSSFDYRILGIDIDQLCINHAKRGVFDVAGLKTIPDQYRPFLLIGENKAQGYFTLDKPILSRSEFSVLNLNTQISKMTDHYDLIFCRNVLIYFTPTKAHDIVKQLASRLTDEGLLVLGHSDPLPEVKSCGLQFLRNSTFTKIKKPSLQSAKKSPSAILIVDDSMIIRRVLTDVFEEGGYHILTAENAQQASKLLKKNSVDLITLDLNMPGEGGKDWMERQRQNGLRIPIVIITGAQDEEADLVLGALESGAQDYIAKADLHNAPHRVLKEIGEILSTAINKHLTKSLISLPKQIEFSPDLLLFGASTGGTEALKTVLKQMPLSSPPIVVVQHIIHDFAKSFANRLAQTSGLKLGKPREGELLKPGHLYLADGEYHIEIRKRDNQFFFKRVYKPSVNQQCPSVDMLFKSATEFANQVGAFLLTGMGEDGAHGLLALKQKGAMTFAQSEASCVVYGMPKSAIELEAAGFIGDLFELRRKMLKCIN